jgi:hypothetical protein
MNYQPSREGDAILVTVPHYWGKGKTFADAKRRLREITGAAFHEHREFHVYSVHPNTNVDACYGDIAFPKGHPPIRLDQ